LGKKESGGKQGMYRESGKARASNKGSSKHLRFPLPLGKRSLFCSVLFAFVPARAAPFVSIPAFAAVASCCHANIRPPTVVIPLA